MPPSRAALQDGRDLRSPISRLGSRLSWGCSRRQRYLHGIEAMLPAPSPGAGPPRCWLPKLALFSLPSWILGAVPQPRTALPPPHPFCGDDDRRRGPGLFCFLKQHLLDRKLLATPSAIRGRALTIFNACREESSSRPKLASLGELVRARRQRVGPSFVAILSNSERMAASSSLSREQLATAQKIGQQARRPANSSTIC